MDTDYGGVMKKVLIISSSLRSSSNSDVLAKAFMKAAQEAGNEVVYESLSGKKIDFCIGCMACHKTGTCVLKDDAVELAEKMKTSDVIVFATPVYFFGMSGKLKTLLDRTNPLYSYPYDFRDIYVLCTAAENEKDTPVGTVNGIQGWIDCFEQAQLKGEVFAGGVSGQAEVNGHPAVAQAYEMGKKV